ncbi:50S ribosomal protein L25/general stress protein Ctc [Denitratisoma oestradiolicum]|uniref:Large ribosomal subunit protein bL25 n=1 Tax=Denitratisoma oestradiolicum TaxID=311182 RepID=A0A6S6Y5K2_9PROT|nr:50S ribosomal protein L25/general stress protein Ctc [Denitratisoma oestradiolicum]TWO81821.1 50S ribosomal protein L25/general stress protein Ctc [Denitratisoma oestradiolicum]CAB1370787.1 50S ribosomal protein L25 [Denitratisoma oestradiolicum]
MQFEINAKKRDLQGSSASRRLRRDGRVPGIVYGAPGAPQSIDIDHNELFQALRKEAFHSSVVTLNIEGEKQMALLRDVQAHAYKAIVLHVDFQRVDATHKVHQKVPLHFINADIAPGVKTQGGMISHVMTEVDVKCLPGDLPAFIEVDLKDMSSGHSIHVSQLPLPKGVEVVHHGEGDPVVATLLVKGGKADEEAEAPAAEAAAAPAEKK